jgi:hypothetical protein
MAEIYIINDLSTSKQTFSAPKGAKMGASMTQIITLVKMLSQIDWLDINKSIQKKDWKNLSFDTLEGALVLVSPWVPQAGVAREVLDRIKRVSNQLPAGQKPFTVEDLMKALAAAQEIDWKELQDAMMGNSPKMARLVLLKDLVKIIKPFVPYSGAAEAILNALVIVSKNVHPANPTVVPGYHWDPLWGWVLDK